MTNAKKFLPSVLAARGWGLGVALAMAAGCGGAQKPPVESAASNGGGSRPDNDVIAQVASQPKEPSRKVSTEEREDFEKALARYQDLKRQGGKLDGSDCDKAAAAFRKAADENPKLREARYNEGAVLMECGREQEAKRIFDQLGNAAPPYAPALASLGYLAWKSGDAAGAERLFNRSVEQDPNLGSVAARNNLAELIRQRVQAVQGDEKIRLGNQAIEHLRRVLAIDGNNLQAYATYSALYYDIGLLEMARLIGGQAIKRGDEIATGKVEEGPIASTGEEKKGKGKEKADAPKASAESKAVGGTGYTREMKAQLGLVYNTLGLVDLKKKSVTSAIANFKRAIEMDPALNESRMNLAALSLNFRDYKTAEENFRAVLASQPRNFEAAIGLGVALRGGKKLDEAEQQYLAAQKIEPNNPQPLYNLGLLYQDYKGGDRASLQKAQQFYREFLAKGSSAPARQRKDAEKRVKDIDEIYKALDEADKLQKEAEEMQRKAEEQQKIMEEQMRKQEAAEKAAGAGAAAPAAPGAAAPTAPPPPPPAKK